MFVAVGVRPDSVTCVVAPRAASAFAIPWVVPTPQPATSTLRGPVASGSSPTSFLTSVVVWSVIACALARCWGLAATQDPRRPGFAPAEFPGDITEFVVREVARTGWAVHARIRIDAPADEVVARINPAVGTVESHPDGGSVLVTGGDSLEVVAVWISMLGMPFHVSDPPELVEHVRDLARRYAAALP